MSKTQPNYIADKLEVIAAGVEETSEVSAVQTFRPRGRSY